MMGYAHRPADLALGKTVDVLHTGDIARRSPDGLYEVIGRSSRFVKMYGLRIDLQRVEATMRDHGVTAFCADVDDVLAVAAAGHDEAEVRRVAATAAGVPAGAVQAVTVSATYAFTLKHDPALWPLLAICVAATMALAAYSLRPSWRRSR